MADFLSCIDEAAVAGDIDPEAADRARKTYRRAYGPASETFGPTEADRMAAEAVMSDLERAALEAKRRKALMIRTRTQVLEGVAALKRTRGYADVNDLGGGGDGGGDWTQGGLPPAKGPGKGGAIFARSLELLVENKPGLSGGPFSSVEDRYRAIRGQADAMMAGLIERFETRTGFDTPNRAELTNIVREAFGEKSGDKAAKGLAQAWSETAENLRRMYNAAGGSIGRMEGWGLPQGHDIYAVRDAGREGWIAQVLPRLDRARMLDGDTGLPLSDVELVAALGQAWESIVSLGANRREPGAALGRGSVATRRMDSRFLIFKSADDWLAYAKAFGDGDAFSTMLGHVDELARDIAQMQIFGPNPDAQFTWLKQAAMREALLEESAGVAGAADRAKGYVQTAEDMLAHFTGSTSTPINSRLAGWGATGRSLLTAYSLGSAVLSDMPSAPYFGAMARSYAGLSKRGDMGQLVKLLNPAGVNARKTARRAGFVNEQATDGFLRATHDNLRLLSVGERVDGGLNALGRRLPAAVLRLQGLTPYNAARKRSFRFEFMGALHDRRGQTIADLAKGDSEDRAFAQWLGARGFSETDWAAIRAAPVWEPSPGAQFLRPTDIEDETLALRLAGAIDLETRFAAPETTLWTRAKLLGTERPGTITGEIRRSWAMTLSESDIHELRLSSASDASFVWSTGLFYFEESQEVGFLSVVDKGQFYSGTEFTFPDVQSDSLAAYFDMTYPVTDQLRLKAGYRYTEENKSRRGIGGNWSLGLGSEAFNCCFVTRLGTEGFRPIFTGRDSYAPPAPGDNQAAARYFQGAFVPGARDTFLDQIAGVADGSRPNGTCVDRPDTQPPGGGQVCPANGQHSFFQISAPGEQVGSYEDSFSDFRLGFEYDLTEDNLLYGTVSTGHKSGGFNDTVVINGVSTAPTFAPESVTLFEVGTKNTFRTASGRIDVNANVFYYDYADQVFQTLVSLGTGPGGASAGFSQQNINVAQSTIQGFELETRFDLPYGMRLDLIGAYIDAAADNGALTDTRGTDYGDGTPNFNIDIGGNDLPNVSKVNLNAHLQQTVDLFGGRADFHLLANYRSSYYLNIYNELPVIQFTARPADAAGQAAYDAFKASLAGTTVNPLAPPASPYLRSTEARDGGFWARQEGYVTVNLGAGWEPDSGRYRLEAYVNNVFDETVVEKQLVSDQVVNVLFLNQARTAGVRLRASF